jgi:triacylglycerol lipase
MGKARSAAPARAAFGLVAGLLVPVLVAACTRGPQPPTTTQPPGPSGGSGRPVLLVSGTLENVSVVNVTRTYLQGRGYRAYSMTLSGTPIGVSAGSAQSGQAICRKIDAILAETGADKVDLVGHSQGSITGRWCIKSGGALNKVDTFVSVGGVDDGTNTALLCSGQGCTDMRHGSAFLRDLNAGAPPGGVRLFKIYSNPGMGGVDGEDAAIRGATNVSAQQLCPGKRLAHADEYRNRLVHTFLDNVLSGRPATGTC